MKTWTMAWRNVWRNRRRTVATVGAMSLALLVMILYSGLATGMLEGLESKLLDVEMGEIQVHAPGYLAKPGLHTAIEEPDALMGKLHDRGYRATARLVSSGLAAAKENSSGARFIGVDLSTNEAVSALGGHVSKGEWLDAAQPRQVVIGAKLARLLGVEPGDELVALSQGADGSMANDVYRIRGILSGVSSALDTGGVLMTGEAFRELFVFPRGAHEIIVRTPNGMPLDGALAEVKTLAPNLDVRSWRQLQPTLASLLDSSRGMMTAMFLIVDIAIALVILNAMLMAVFERIRELGVLGAIGVGPFRIAALVFMESAVMCLWALILGTVLSIPGLWYLARHGIDVGAMGGMSLHGMSWDTIWKASVSGETFAVPCLTLVFVVAVATVYPAVKAAVVTPVEALGQR